MIAGMKKLHEEQKKLQASNLKIEKMIGDIQRSNEQTAAGHSSKVPLPRDLSVSLKQYFNCLHGVYCVVGVGT